jgi:hypothetical protein
VQTPPFNRRPERRSTRHLLVVAAAACVLAAVVTVETTSVGGAADLSRTSPAAFSLVFDGKHTPTLLHEGPFTASASFCLSGYATDVSVESDVETAVRSFKCAGSADEFTARVKPLPGEHGGSGSWQIVAGSGSLTDLRGKGTWSSVRLSGATDDPEAITFRSTWQGVTDFDASPPTIVISKSSARKLRRPKGAYLLRIVLSFTDAPGNTVLYELAVIDPRTSLQVVKSGETRTGIASVSLRVRPTRRTRVLRLKIEAGDPVGNASEFARVLRIR